MEDLLDLVDDFKVKIVDNDFEGFLKLAEESGVLFDQMLNQKGFWLIRWAMKYERQEIFDYLLPMQPSKNLLWVLSHMTTYYPKYSYYVYKLVENGPPLDTLSCINFPGAYDDPKMIKLFLDRGLDPNIMINNKEYLLHHILHKLVANCYDEGKQQECTNEIVAMLLYYGADPTRISICDECRYLPRECNDFEAFCLTSIPDFVFEQLFMYNFDDQMLSGKIHLSIFLQLVGHKKNCETEGRKLLIDKLLDYDLDFLVEDLYPEIFLHYMVHQDFDCFKVMVRRCPKAIRVIFEEADFGTTYYGNFCERFAEKMQHLFFEDASLFNCVITFFEKLNASGICRSAVKFLSEADASKFMLILAQYGFRWTIGCFHTIYETYGDCALFRTLLHLDVKNEGKRESVLTSFICNVSLDVETFVRSTPERRWKNTGMRGDGIFLKTPFGYLTTNEASRLLDLFVDSRLSNFLLNTRDLPESIFRKIQLLPKVPSLRELTRDVYRKHLIETFHLKTTKQFITLCNVLSIGVEYRRILTFESRLYNTPVPDAD